MNAAMKSVFKKLFKMIVLQNSISPVIFLICAMDLADFILSVCEDG
jgi:hypothetical protein